MDYMKKSLFWALALVAIAGCAKEAVPAPEFHAVTESNLETKVNVGYDEFSGVYQVKWVNTDKVWINGSRYSVTPGNPATTADFSLESGNTPTSPYKAFCPHDAVSSADGGVKFTMPSSITSTNHDVAFWPMYAESGSNTFSFKNLCGLVAVSIRDANESRKVTKVQISCTGHYLNGTASVIPDGDVWKAGITSGEDANKITTVNLSEPMDIKQWGGVYFPIPPAVYGTDFTITFTYDSGSPLVKTVKTGKSIEVGRSKVTSIAFNIYSPSGTSNEPIGWGETYTEADFN